VTGLAGSIYEVVLYYTGGSGEEEEGFVNSLKALSEQFILI
jgi:hypothetical protein